MMGLEEHLLNMFRQDFEFHEGAAASHLGSAAVRPAAPAQTIEQPLPETTPAPMALAPGATVSTWSADAEQELRKIPFFVRGKARRNTERFALDRGVPVITIETLYDAKAHYSR